nr:UBN2_3 domain-containing protein [Tanacetum cinerariifolium]
MAGNNSNPKNTTTSEEITSNHPLYLHQTDHPGLILISKKLTGSDNYSSLKRSLMIALNAKNKMRIITGEFAEPNRDSELRALWERNNDMLISWILNTAPYLCLCLCNCANGRINGERGQRKRLIQFLIGFDESYSNIRGQILLMQPLPTTAKAYTMVRQEENKEKGAYYGNCSKEGHLQEECYKIVGYPVGHPLYGKVQPAKQSEPGQDYKRTVNMDQNKGIAHGSLCDGLYFLSSPLTSSAASSTILYNSYCEPLPDLSHYRTLVGKLIYLTITRPDISFAAQLLSKFSQAPMTTHMKALPKVLRYIKPCLVQGIPKALHYNSLSKFGICDSFTLPTWRRGGNGTQEAANTGEITNAVKDQHKINNIKSSIKTANKLLLHLRIQRDCSRM